MSKKIIVTDVDGVLLNWEDAFQIWMEHQGFEKVKNVNERTNNEIIICADKQ